VKFKTNQMKVCQGCRQNYEGHNDTMGLVVARAEKRLVSNLVNGSQFLGRESNSHYHLYMQCLRKADPMFMSKDLVIPEEIISKHAKNLPGYFPDVVIILLDVISIMGVEAL